MVVGLVVLFVIFVVVFGLTSLVMIATSLVYMQYDLHELRMKDEPSLKAASKPHKTLLANYVAALIAFVAIAVVAHFCGLL